MCPKFIHSPNYIPYSSLLCYFQELGDTQAPFTSWKEDDPSTRVILLVKWNDPSARVRLSEMGDDPSILHM